MMNLYKKYIDVELLQKKDGEIVPQFLLWTDGKRYPIDKVISKERRASPVGGCGMRYTCLIQGKRRNLFLEKDRWFIESLSP